MAELINGKAFAANLRGRLSYQVKQLQHDHNIVPGLAVVLVGNDPASQIYVRNKHHQALECGLRPSSHRLPSTISQHSLLDLVTQLNADPAVNGILVQLPLPQHIDGKAVLNAIDPNKDVDGFHPVNVGRLAIGEPGLVPCTPLGCLLLLQHYLDNLSGLEAVILGRSNIVGKPMAQLLLAEHCTVTIAHSRTRDLPAVCRRADILVTAVGQPGLVRGDWIKPGATVLDVGINRITEGAKTRLVGDVDFASAAEVAGAITPVPGGVGPMTIACLLRNTVTATCQQRGLPVPEMKLA